MQKLTVALNLHDNRLAQTLNIFFVWIGDIVFDD